MGGGYGFRSRPIKVVKGSSMSMNVLSTGCHRHCMIKCCFWGEVRCFDDSTCLFRDSSSHNKGRFLSLQTPDHRLDYRLNLASLLGMSSSRRRSFVCQVSRDPKGDKSKTTRLRISWRLHTRHNHVIVKHDRMAGEVWAKRIGQNICSVVKSKLKNLCQTTPAFILENNDMRLHMSS